MLNEIDIAMRIDLVTRPINRFPISMIAHPWGLKLAFKVRQDDGKPVSLLDYWLGVHHGINKEVLDLRFISEVAHVVHH